MNKSDELKKDWPLYFGDSTPEIEILAKCKVLMEELENRYFIECNPFVTRKHIVEIKSILSEIKKLQQP